MNLPVSARPDVQSLQSSLIRDVANAGMGRTDVLPFWFGESDQPTPRFIREAAMASLADGETFYSQNLGRPYLRDAIAGYLTGLHGTTIEPGRIAATIQMYSFWPSTGELPCRKTLSPFTPPNFIERRWPESSSRPAFFAFRSAIIFVTASFWLFPPPV